MLSGIMWSGESIEMLKDDAGNVNNEGREGGCGAQGGVRSIS